MKIKTILFILLLLNVLMHVIVFGTSHGDQPYSNTIQKEIANLNSLNIPPRPVDAMTGSEFMQSVMNSTFEERENRIFEEISNGNIPNFLRTLTKIEATFYDADGVAHTVNYEVMPDYLAIGSDEDFCRIPMGPITAQKLADLFGAAMPTRKLVNNIYVNSEIKLAPVTYPWSDESVKVSKFVEHNNDIEAQRRAANAILGQLVGGIKKDVVISNRIVDPSSANHVVIYGWHQLNGEPIQPLYSGHLNTYVDYSHGIRFINSEMLIDDSLAIYQNILMDDKLYKILSDETGAMEQPSYLKIPGIPDKPISFGVINLGANSLKILLEPDSNVTSYKIYLSNNGIDFNDPIELSAEDLTINDLSENSIYYLKLKAVNQIGESGYSEVLAGIPSSNMALNLLIVNAFDRSTDGNTYDFIRQHGSAFYYNAVSFNSATNEAIINGLFNLNDYPIVDYILGEESTADESFNSTEQSIVSNYLINGGNLLVTGSEIAWDLDYKGSSNDKYFIRNFLKMQFATDAPYNTSSTYYEVELVENDYIYNPTSFFFDNGSHGTYDVKWPDVILESQGSKGFIKYAALDTQSGYAGLLFEGLFPGGDKPGKIISLGFPFETIYPETNRNIFASEILKFFNSPNSVSQKTIVESPTNYHLSQNYPNPFNPTTKINYSIVKQSHVTLMVFDLLGRKVATLVNKEQPQGYYEVTFEASSINSQTSSGVYFYRIQAIPLDGQTDNFVDTKKMMLLK